MRGTQPSAPSGLPPTLPPEAKRSFRIVGGLLGIVAALACGAGFVNGVIVAVLFRWSGR